MVFKKSISKATQRNWKRLKKRGRLKSRANKLNSSKKFIPREYLTSHNSKAKIEEIYNFSKKNDLDVYSCLYYLAKAIGLDVKNKYFKKELEKLLSKSNQKKICKNYCDFFANLELSENEDFLGVVYQAFLQEGKKSFQGSYYTPEKEIKEISKEYYSNEKKILDPCCGTGQFLLHFARTGANYNNLCGVELDETAQILAKINLMFFFKDKEFEPKIYNHDFLLSDIKELEENSFDIVATNPPWGAYIDEKKRKKLKTKFDFINSYESFSYFIAKSQKYIKDSGVMSFILPVSILNIKSHKDIRKFILENLNIKKVESLGKIFSNVLTSALRLDLQKTQDIQTKKYKNQFIKNKDFEFDINVNIKDKEILDKIYSNKKELLKGKLDFGLGIVTGDNKRHIKNKKTKENSSIITGKEVKAYILDEAKKYVSFNKEKFQQTARQELYFAKEKLIYKFISKRLVFAYDDKKQLTLNSANIITTENYNIKFLLALLNSDIYNFIFEKKFFSIKILRRHIENLPIPKTNKKIEKEIILLTEEILQTKNLEKNKEEIEQKISHMFGLTKDEFEHIRQNIK